MSSSDALLCVGLWSSKLRVRSNFGFAAYAGGCAVLLCAIWFPYLGFLWALGSAESPSNCKLLYRGTFREELIHGSKNSSDLNIAKAGTRPQNGFSGTDATAPTWLYVGLLTVSYSTSPLFDKK